MSFESIFSSNTNVDSKLSALFNRKAVKKVDTPAVVAEKAKVAEEEKEAEFKRLDPEREARTIFIGNLPADCKKPELMKVFKTFGKIESLRFRNGVPEDLTKSKKYAFITKQQHAKKLTITAFIRYTERDEAKNAASEANGMEFKNNHLRVDIANQGKAHDNKRSLFLGNLPFDICEESIYTHFEKCGPIDNVRIIRDNLTGIGKGFGYVQFKTADSLALGIKLDASDLCDRKIRVNRCVKKLKAKKDAPGHQTQHYKDADKRTARSSNNRFQKQFDKTTSERLKRKEKPPKTSFTKKNGDNKKDSKKDHKKKKTNKKPHIGTNSKNKTRFRI